MPEDYKKIAEQHYKEKQRFIEELNIELPLNKKLRYRIKQLDEQLEGIARPQGFKHIRTSNKDFTRTLNICGKYGSK